MSEYRDQEIDFRPYVEAILGKWYWILGLGLLAGILAFGATSLLVAPTYEATALVSITEPRQRVQFDPRIVTVEENQPLRAYPEIAVSDELLEELMDELPEGSASSVQRLRSMLKASPGGDPSLLKLSVTNSDPILASNIANSWAEMFVSWANRAYGDSGEEQLIFFEQRLDDAEVDLQAAEKALVDYQAENRSAILDTELLALLQTQADLLAKKGEIDLLLQDIESLLVLFQDNTSGEETSAIVDQFTMLILKLRAFGGVPGSLEETVPWQLQVTTSNLEAENATATVQQVQSLQDALQIQAEQTESALAEIEPEILAIQQEKQLANAREALMLRNVQVAEDTHTALARTVEEKRITSQDVNAGVRLASRSTVPESPVGPRKTINALAAALGVIFLAVLVIIVVIWWRDEDEPAALPDADN